MHQCGTSDAHFARAVILFAKNYISFKVSYMNIQFMVVIDYNVSPAHRTVYFLNGLRDELTSKLIERRLHFRPV